MKIKQEIKMEKLEKYKLPYDNILSLIKIKSYVQQSKLCFIVPARNLYCRGVRVSNNLQIEYNFNCGIYEGKRKKMPPKSLHSEENKDWSSLYY